MLLTVLCLLLNSEVIRLKPLSKACAASPGVRSANGTAMAGTTTALSDGVAMLIMSEKANELGLTIRARIKGMAIAGCDPSIMGYGPVPATRKPERAGLSIEDMDVVELNEAFTLNHCHVRKIWVC